MNCTSACWRAPAAANCCRGKLRDRQNWIGPHGATLHEAVFIPPPPSNVESALREWEQFLTQSSDMPPIVRAGLAHAQLETIHPFLDGNGRVGRLFIALFLCEQQVLRRPVLYLSHYFKQYRSLYYERLQAIRDHGDWEDWIEFFVRGVHKVSEEATESIRKVLALQDRHRRVVAEQLGRAAGNGLRILDHLYTRPILRAKDVQGLLGITYAGANALVARFLSLGLLEEITGWSRNRIFRYAPYLDLFAD